MQQQLDNRALKALIEADSLDFTKAQLKQLVTEFNDQDRPMLYIHFLRFYSWLIGWLTQTQFDEMKLSGWFALDGIF